jgi:HPt (histidine-containing phosphotransfer) domain-containing protein
MTAHAMQGDRERCLAAGMDGYISKPIRPRELFQMIERLGLRPPESDKSGAKPQMAKSDVLDLAEMLTHVDGDRQLLKEIVELFLEDCPKQLSDIRQAITQGDSAALMRTAHTLKGSVGNFAAKAAVDLALQLEMMGRQGNLAGAQEACSTLEKEIEHLKLALEALTKEQVV